MSSNEITLVNRRYHERVAAILAPDELARYEGYQQRLQAPPAQPDAAPVEPSPAEQAVLDKIMDDQQAAALHKQLMVLLRIEKLPQ